jgi:hypothetical protein
MKIKAPHVCAFKIYIFIFFGAQKFFSTSQSNEPFCCQVLHAPDHAPAHVAAADAADGVLEACSAAQLAASLASAARARQAPPAAYEPDDDLYDGLTSFRAGGEAGSSNRSSNRSSSNHGNSNNGSNGSSNRAKGSNPGNGAAAYDPRWRLCAVEGQLAAVLRRERRQKLALHATTQSCSALEAAVVRARAKRAEALRRLKELHEEVPHSSTLAGPLGFEVCSTSQW